MTDTTHPATRRAATTWIATIAGRLDDGSLEQIGRVRVQFETEADDDDTDTDAIAAEALDIAANARDLDHAPEDLVVTALHRVTT